MKILRPLQTAVTELSPEELAEFRRWFAQFDFTAWNAEIETDAECGKLDDFVSAAVAEFHTGRLRKL